VFLKIAYFISSGRKPIEPEKYYNLPIESSDEESEPVVRKPVK
jgi:hypothetical protein